MQLNVDQIKVASHNSNFGKCCCHFWNWIIGECVLGCGFDFRSRSFRFFVVVNVLCHLPDLHNVVFRDRADNPEKVFFLKIMLVSLLFREKSDAYHGSFGFQEKSEIFAV